MELAGLPAGPARSSCGDLDVGKMRLNRLRPRKIAQHGGLGPGSGEYVQPKAGPMKEIEAGLNGADLRIAVVRGRFNEPIGAGLLAACLERLGSARRRARPPLRW